MAEEEVLTEEVAMPRREKSGMPPAIILGVMVIGFVVVIGAIVLIVGGLGKKISNPGVVAAQGAGGIKKTECTGKQLRIFYLTPADADQGIRFTLKDGNYIITKIALCVDAKTSDDTIKTDQAVLGSIMTTFFLRYNSDQVLMKPGPVEGEAPKQVEQKAPDLLATEEDTMDDTATTPSKRFEELESRLFGQLTQNLKYVKGVYLWETDVVPAIK